MKRVLSILLLAALTVGFVSCDKSENGDSKPENKLIGEWNLNTVKATLKMGDTVLDEQTVTLPSQDLFVSVKFGFKEDGTYEITTTMAENETEVEIGRYTVADNVINLYEPDQSEVPIPLNIIELTSKKLTVQLSQAMELGEIDAELHFDKL
ncbi:MAG: DUF5004 domain-containing protein [Alistipes sp.]|nr:DUF5004 domain-containing protein [Alistipes sp.]